MSRNPTAFQRNYIVLVHLRFSYKISPHVSLLGVFQSFQMSGLLLCLSLHLQQKYACMALLEVVLEISLFTSFILKNGLYSQLSFKTMRVVSVPGRTES